MINLVITELTYYSLDLPKGNIKLYGAVFTDGLDYKTVTASGPYQIVIDVEPYPNTSNVIEVWAGNYRIQTIIVEYPDTQYLDPFYVKNSPHYVKAADRATSCPTLYSAFADVSTVTSNQLFSALPTSQFNALDSQEILYERETHRLWWLTMYEPISVTHVEEWAHNPIVNFFVYRDTLDSRFFIFVHQSGLIRKLDTTYTEVASTETGFKFIDAVKFPDVTIISDFITLDADGNIRKYGIDLVLKSTTVLVGAIRLFSDTYSKSATSVVHAVTAIGDAYTISTTLALTKSFGLNVGALSPRQNSGATYMWSYSPTNYFHLVDSAGALVGSTYYKAFPLEFSFDAVYIRATDGWSKVWVGVGQSQITFPAGSNPFIAFQSKEGNTYYIGRSRTKAPEYIVTEDWYRPQLDIVDFNRTTHVARVRVTGVNTELGIDLPTSVNVAVTDFYTGLSVSTIEQDTVLVLTGIDETNLDSKFWISVGKSEIEVELGGKIYIPDLVRVVGTVVTAVADAVDASPSFAVSADPEVEVVAGVFATSYFDILPASTYAELSSVQASSPEYVGAAVCMEIDAADGYQLEYSVSSIGQSTPVSIPLAYQDVQASSAEASKLVDMFDIISPTAYYETQAPVSFNDQAIAFDINKRVYAEAQIIEGPEAVPFPTNTLPNRQVSEYPRYLNYTSALASKYKQLPIDYVVGTWFNVDLQAPKVTAPLAAKWRTESEPYWIATLFEYTPVVCRYWVDTAFVQSTVDLVDRYWVDTKFIDSEIRIKYFVDCLASYKTDSVPYRIDLVAAHRPQDYMVYVRSVYEMRTSYRYAEYDRGINNLMPAVVWSNVDLSPQYNTALPTPELDLRPFSAVLEFALMELLPKVPEAQYSDIGLEAQTFTQSFSTALGALAIDASISPTTIEGSVKQVLIADLISERTGVEAGYFLTEYAALQNAVNIWGMEPSAIFAKQLSTGYWVWLRTIECENTCDDSACETSGYITGG